MSTTVEDASVADQKADDEAKDSIPPKSSTQEVRLAVLDLFGTIDYEEDYDYKTQRKRS